MAAIVYLLCTLTSLLCAIMLFRAFKKSQFRLLFWSSMGFIGFGISNILLFIDVVVFPDVTYILNFRSVPAVVGMITMIYGLIMEEV